MGEAGEITQLLRAYDDGDRTAFDRLVPLVYDELRRLARVPLSEHLGFGFDLGPRTRRFLMMESAAAAAHPVSPRVVLALGGAAELSSRRP